MFSKIDFKTREVFNPLFGSIVPDSKDFVDVDNFMSKEFFENECGWTRNDLSALAAAQTKQQYDAIVERLQINQPKFDMRDGETIKDRLSRQMSRYCQSPNEIQQYAEMVASAELSRLSDDAYKNALNDVKVQTHQTAETTKSE